MSHASVRIGVAVMLLLATTLAAGAADTNTPVKTEKANAGSTATTASKISLEAKDATLNDLIDKLAEQSKKKFVVESTVKGKVGSFSVKDVTLESALTALCKAGKCDWRKVYIAPESKLLEQPNKMAATVRLLSAMAFPDIVVAGSSNGKVAAHYVDAKAVQANEDVALKQEGMTEVYLVTNDAAVAEKEKNEEDKEKSGSKAVEEYAKMQRESMDKFTKMTPEEQEQALIASIEQFQQMDPGYLASVMKAMMRMGPEAMERIQRPQMDMLFNMSAEDRRQLMKVQMKMQNVMTPDQRKILEEDVKAIMEEMKNDLGAPPP